MLVKADILRRLKTGHLTNRVPAGGIYESERGWARYVDPLNCRVVWVRWRHLHNGFMVAERLDISFASLDLHGRSYIAKLVRASNVVLFNRRCREARR